MLSAKPPPEVNTSKYFADEPALTETETGETDGAKSGGPAHPVSATVCVPGLALSVKVILPVRGPFVVGVNITWMKQLPFTVNEFVHVLV